MRGAVRARRRSNRLSIVLGGIVVAFMLAFFSLAQSVRVAATGYDINRLMDQRQTLLDRKQELLSDLNRLGSEPGRLAGRPEDEPEREVADDENQSERDFAVINADDPVAARQAAEARGISVRFAVPVLLFIALFTKSLFTYFSEFELNGIGVAMVRDLRRDAYQRLLYQSTRFYSQGSTGDLMSRMLSDVEQIQHAFGHNLTDLVQGLLTLLLLLVYVFSLDARLALLVFVLAPFVLLPIVNNTRRLGRAATATRERIGEMGALLSETLRSNAVIIFPSAT